MGLSANSYTHSKSLGTGIIPNLLPTLTGTSSSAEAESNRPSPAPGTGTIRSPRKPGVSVRAPPVSTVRLGDTTSQHGR